MKSSLALSIATIAGITSATQAATLYSDNFNVNSSANYSVNKSQADTATISQQANFAFNYGAFGIPAAPGSSDTVGLQLKANVPSSNTRPAGATSGLSVSPTGQNFGTSYHVSVDVWSNFNGANNFNAANGSGGLGDNANSAGGTNNILMEVGTAGATTQVLANPNAITGTTIDGVAFATTGDGGIGNDYRVFAASNTVAAPSPTTIYGAGTDATVNQNINTFYTSKASLAPHTAPAVQQDIAAAEFTEPSGKFNPQLGSTQAGAFGFAWHHVDIIKDGNTVAWIVDGNFFASQDVSALTLGGANLALGVSDVNTSTTQYASLLFTVFDNLVVTDQVPEPASLSVLVMGGLGLLARRRRA